jgi:hypothetical protein
MLLVCLLKDQWDIGLVLYYQSHSYNVLFVINVCQ